MERDSNQKTQKDSSDKISDIIVHYPELQQKPLNSYMKYKISFSHKGNELEIFRRYSDFSSLRKNLRTYMPFHYIFPMHQKKMISNTDTSMLNDRVEELNFFLNYVIENQEKFDCDAFWKFFDMNLQDTKIGEILDKMNLMTYEYAEFVLKKRYPKLFEVNQKEKLY